MKTPSTIRRLALLCLSAFALSVIAALAAEAPPSGTNVIQGVVRFTNADTNILARLGPPGNEGMAQFILYAYAAGPPALLTTKNIINTNYLTNAYEVTVSAGATSLTYQVSAALYLDGSSELYYTTPLAAAPLTSNSPPATVNFDECVALLELRFQLSNGAPVAVSGERATVTETGPPYGLRAQYGSASPGRTNNFLVVPSGVEFELVIEVDTGTDIYSNRLTHAERHVMTLNCDDTAVVTITVPDPGGLGQIKGSLNMVGEIELPTDGYLDLLGRPVMIASGPGGNQRYSAVAAEFPGPDTDRVFTLPNLVPSSVTQAWSLHAEMQFRTGYRFEYFRSPGLGEGTNNAGIVVTAGEANDLGDTFVMHPAKLVGKVTLTGPPEFGANISALRGLLRSADYDSDTNGIPDGVGPAGINYSYITATGVDELAPGATLTAAGGLLAASFAGAFNPTNSAFEGDYDATLGMLSDQPGVWKRDTFYFVIYHPATNGGPYVNQGVAVVENEPWQGALAPGQCATNDVRYGLAEVCLRIRSPAPFYNPRVAGGTGVLNGIDSTGSNRNYTVSVYAYGRPDSAVDATHEAIVTMYLPEGSYTLQPVITTIDPGGGESATQLPPVDVSVVAGDRLCIEDCLRVSIEPPVCTTNFGFLARANATSCDATLTNLSLTARSLENTNARLGYSDIRILIGARTNLTTAHGLFPEFDGFPLSYYNDILYTAVAKDNQGRVATLQIVAHYDFTAPTIQCPPDITVLTTNPAGTAVNFTVTATDDRPGPVNLVCTPPSGSVFPIGTNTVTCRASDLCHNTNTCTFQIVVVDDCLHLEIEPPICTTNFGFLAFANAFSCEASLTNLSLSSYSLSDTNIRLGYSDIRIFVPPGMARTNLRTGHGLFPEYDGYQDHLEYYNDILYVAVARDNRGRVAIAQFVGHYDFTPPTITCPPDLIVGAVDAMGGPAYFTVTAVDNRPEPINLIVTPPSGSLFPIGTTVVTCRANDLCHNTNTCTFRLIVRGVNEPLCPLNIELAQRDPLLVTLSWDCSGILQSSPNPDGPWTDEPGATTPHPIPADVLLRKFFRLRFDGGG